MRKIIVFLIMFISFSFSLSYAQEWGNLEINTEVSSKYGQDYTLSFEKWWDENLGLGGSIFYNSLENVFLYKSFLKTPYLKFVLGRFYPNLNLFTENLELNGYQLSFYFGNNEIFYISGKGVKNLYYSYIFYKKDTLPLKILGWNSPLTKNSRINLSLMSIRENMIEDYMLTISYLNEKTIPLGNITIFQEGNFFLKNSNLYSSFFTKAALALGSISLKGILGYLNPNTPSFCVFDSGDLGGILSILIPLSSNVFPEYILGYTYNLQDFDHKIILGLNLQYNLTASLNLVSTAKYVYSFKNSSDLFTQIALNFPTLEGAIWNSIYLKYIKEMEEENISLGLKISYQF